MSENAKPRPGTIEAVAQGCLCPIIDNLRSELAGGEEWVDERCPIHGDGREPVPA